MDLRSYKTAGDRRQALEKETGVPMTHTGSFTFDEAAVDGRNCENLVGAAQIPVGVAGPLPVKPREGVTRDVYLPLATTEGALVASVNRGCRAIRESGGAVVDAQRVGATRGPVFKVRSAEENHVLGRYLKENFESLQQVAATTSGHIRLKKLTSQRVGHYRYIRFVFDTQDAMGMNMVTVATDALARHIGSETGAACLALSGNYCVDKKPAWINAIDNRGIAVWAETVLTQKVLRDVLKTDARAFYDVWLSKCMIGSAMSGSMAFNAQFANVIAALFAATGQDLGHIGECSIGITTAEIVRDPSSEAEELLAGVYLPGVMLGTVGGGTALATQNEALTLLGVAGGDGGAHATELAHIVGAAVLAGEISLLASLSEGTLAVAHRKLGRKGK